MMLNIFSASVRSVIIAATATLSFACVTHESTVALDFENAEGELALRTTQTASTTFLTPVHYGAKLLSIYLSEDIDDLDGANTGDTTFIYVHPECEDLSTCDVQEGDGIQTVIRSPFEFAAPSEEINAALRAEEQPILPGTYRHLRMEWCKYADNVDTISFRTEDMPIDIAHRYNAGGCTTDVELDPPLVLDGDDQVQLTLRYDLYNAIQRRHQTPCDEDPSCYENEGTSWRIAQPVQFTPIVSKAVWNGQNIDEIIAARE